MSVVDVLIIIVLVVFLACFLFAMMSCVFSFCSDVFSFSSKVQDNQNQLRSIEIRRQALQTNQVSPDFSRDAGYFSKYATTPSVPTSVAPIAKPNREAFGVQDCAICLEPLNANDNLTKCCQCGHCSHRTCLDEWLKDHNECPLCRKRCEINF